jgi:hypothetical protein
VELLERIGNAAARSALKDLTQHAKDNELRRDAAEALQRLAGLNGLCADKSSTMPEE